MASEDSIYIAGPTASGKTRLALEIAKRVSGEVISVDSIQVYRGLDIGSAKPTRDEQSIARHHGIDFCEVHERCDTHRYLETVRAAETQIRAAGMRPIYCGGAGLYFQALLEGIGEAPPMDPALRTELEATSLEDLLTELAQKDPETFEHIDRNNPRRVLRAIEVIRLTGRTFSEQRSSWRRRALKGPKIVCLDWERDALCERIHRRVDQMVERGLFEETQAAIERGLLENSSASHAIGYRQAIQFLNGELAREEAVEWIRVRTRQYAKRQRTWFRQQLPVEWVPIENERALLELANRWSA